MDEKTKVQVSLDSIYKLKKISEGTGLESIIKPALDLTAINLSHCHLTEQILENIQGAVSSSVSAASNNGFVSKDVRELVINILDILGKSIEDYQKIHREGEAISEELIAEINKKIQAI